MVYNRTSFGSRSEYESPDKPLDASSAYRYPWMGHGTRVPPPAAALNNSVQETQTVNVGGKKFEEGSSKEDFIKECTIDAIRSKLNGKTLPDGFMCSLWKDRLLLYKLNVRGGIIGVECGIVVTSDHDVVCCSYDELVTVSVYEDVLSREQQVDSVTQLLKLMSRLDSWRRGHDGDPVKTSSAVRVKAEDTCTAGSGVREQEREKDIKKEREKDTGQEKEREKNKEKDKGHDRDKRMKQNRELKRKRKREEDKEQVKGEDIEKEREKSSIVTDSDALSPRAALAENRSSTSLCHSDCHSDCHTNCHSDGPSNCRRNCHSDSHSYCHRNCRSDCRRNCHKNGHTNCHKNGHTNCHSDGHRNGHSDCHSNVIVVKCEVDDITDLTNVEETGSNWFSTVCQPVSTGAQSLTSGSSNESQQKDIKPLDYLRPRSGQADRLMAPCLGSISHASVSRSVGCIGDVSDDRDVAGGWLAVSSSDELIPSITRSNSPTVKPMERTEFPETLGTVWVIDDDSEESKLSLPSLMAGSVETESSIIDSVVTSVCSGPTARVSGSRKRKREPSRGVGDTDVLTIEECSSMITSLHWPPPPLKSDVIGVIKTELADLVDDPVDYSTVGQKVGGLTDEEIMLVMKEEVLEDFTSAETSSRPLTLSNACQNVVAQAVVKQEDVSQLSATMATGNDHLLGTMATSGCQLPGAVVTGGNWEQNTMETSGYQLPGTMATGAYQLPPTMTTSSFQLSSTMETDDSTMASSIFQLPTTMATSMFQLPTTMAMGGFQVPSTMATDSFQLLSTMATGGSIPVVSDATFTSLLRFCLVPVVTGPSTGNPFKLMDSEAQPPLQLLIPSVTPPLSSHTTGSTTGSTTGYTTSSTGFTMASTTGTTTGTTMGTTTGTTTGTTGFTTGSIIDSTTCFTTGSSTGFTMASIADSTTGVTVASTTDSTTASTTETSPKPKSTGAKRGRGRRPVKAAYRSNILPAIMPRPQAAAPIGQNCVYNGTTLQPIPITGAVGGGAVGAQFFNTGPFMQPVSAHSSFPSALGPQYMPGTMQHVGYPGTGQPQYMPGTLPLQPVVMEPQPEPLDLACRPPQVNAQPNGKKKRQRGTYPSDSMLEKPRFRTKFTAAQTRRLTDTYKRQRFVSYEEKCQLARELGLHPKTIHIYFQNKRGYEMKRKLAAERKLKLQQASQDNN